MHVSEIIILMPDVGSLKGVFFFNCCWARKEMISYPNYEILEETICVNKSQEENILFRKV